MKPEKKPINGMLLFDKPLGISSNNALQKVKRVLNAQKCGHTGSLDMLATGLLPICFGEATKLTGFLLNAGKHYTTTLKLGVITTTADAEGEVLETRPVGDFSDDEIQSVLSRFTGTINQTPPMHSAIKQQGQRLYKLARQGITVEREAREITIHELTLLERGVDWLTLHIGCSKGTYVRTLAEDIGLALGCGAYVESLRRVRVGDFAIENAYTMEELETMQNYTVAQIESNLIGTDQILAHEPSINLSRDASFYLGRGQPVLVPHAPTCGWVKLYDEGRQFIGIGQVLDDGRIAPRRLVSVEQSA